MYPVEIWKMIHCPKWIKQIKKTQIEQRFSLHSIHQQFELHILQEEKEWSITLFLYQDNLLLPILWSKKGSSFLSIAKSLALLQSSSYEATLPKQWEVHCKQDALSYFLLYCNTINKIDVLENN